MLSVAFLAVAAAISGGESCLNCHVLILVEDIADAVPASARSGAELCAQLHRCCWRYLRRHLREGERVHVRSGSRNSIYVSPMLSGGCDVQLPACHREQRQDRRCVRQPSSRRGMCLNITCFLPSDMSCLSPSVLVSPARTARSRTLSLLATRAPESLSWRVPRRTSSLPTTRTSTAGVRTSTRERYERELDVLACCELH